MVGAVALVRFLPDSATVEQNAEQLTRAQADTDTVVGAWREKIAKSSPVAAYKAFKAVNGEIEFNQQHNNAHLFGEALYRETGIPGVAICDSEFGFGCYHSFFGWALLSMVSVFLRNLIKPVSTRMVVKVWVVSMVLGTVCW
ncbi:MAG: hypothetical protein R3B69_04360 [Candidatus Paceibacterota bacterium]